MNYKVKIIVILTILTVFSSISVDSQKNSGFIAAEGKTSGITLNFLTRHASTITNAYRDAFLLTPEAIALDIDNVVAWPRDSSLWIGDAGTGLFDFAWGGGPTTFDLLMKEGLLPVIDDVGVMVEVDAMNETIAGAPLKRYDDSSDLVWVGAAISSFGFTINEDELNSKGIFEEDYPSTWYDLASPKYWREGRQLLSIGNAPDTTSNTRIYEIILQGQGWENGWGLISAMAGNAEILGGSVDVLNSVITGEAGIAATIDFYGYEAQLANPACKYIIPQGQSIINADPICLIEGDAGKRAGANAFLEYVLSQEGQKLWMENDISRLPIRDDFGFEQPDGTPREDLEYAFYDAVNNQGIEFNDTLSLETSNALIYYFESVLTDSHVQLQEVWEKLVDMYNVPSINEPTFEHYRGEIGAPMMTLDYAKQINDQILSDDGFRNNQQDTWQTLAISQYSDVSTELDDPISITPTTSSTTTTTTSDIDTNPVTTTTDTTTTTGTTTTTTSTKTYESSGFQVFSIILSILAISITIRRQRR